MVHADVGFAYCPHWYVVRCWAQGAKSMRLPTREGDDSDDDDDDDDDATARTRGTTLVAAGKQATPVQPAP